MKKLISTIVMVILLTVNIFANYEEVLCDTAQVVLETVTEPVIGSVGGDWAVIGLARSGIDISDEYYEEYYIRVLEHIIACKGVLHERKYTEYSRVIIALTAIGKNPENVAGYNLIEPLYDYDATVKQGVNGAAWALIALDCGNYKAPVGVREQYVNKLLSSQLPDGGWSLACRDGDIADADITGMVLQALSGYRKDTKVSDAINKALICLAEIQNETGGFTSFGADNSESCVHVLSAFATLGISPEEQRFVKNGNSVLDGLLTFYVEGQGFKHIVDGEVNVMSTEQALYALSFLKSCSDPLSKALLQIYGVKSGTLYAIKKIAGDIK